MRLLSPLQCVFKMLLRASGAWFSLIFTCPQTPNRMFSVYSTILLKLLLLEARYLFKTVGDLIELLFMQIISIDIYQVGNEKS